MILIVTLGYGVIGFIDDYRKVMKGNSDGLSAKSKYLSENLEKSIDYAAYMEQNLSTLSFSDDQRRESMDENKTKTDKSGK